MESVSRDAGSASGSTGEVLKQALVIDTEAVRGHLDEAVRSTVEETLNRLLDEEADRVAGAGRYERSPVRLDKQAVRLNLSRLAAQSHCSCYLHHTLLA